MNQRHDTLLGPNDRKSALSVVYASAVAASAGYVATPPSLDRDSIDLPINATGPMFPKALILRRCAWWISLLGEPERDQTTCTVRLRDDQRFKPDSLRQLMA